MIKFTLIVPDRLKAAVLEQMLTWRAEVPGVSIKLTEKRDTRPPMTPSAVDVSEPSRHEGSVPEDCPSHLSCIWPHCMPPGTCPTHRAVAPDRSTKVYRVIDTAMPIGSVPQTVRLYLIDHPNSTARQVIQATGRGQKSIESALWMLRSRGIVKESAKA